MLRFENVNVRFNGRYVLKDFSLEINEQDKILLYGRSGIGKSTIIKLALGYLIPESGKVYFKGNLLNKDVVWRLRRETAYVSQDMEIGSGSVMNYLKMIFSYKANAHLQNFEEDLNRLLNYFELNEESRQKNIEELSGGEKQRLLIVTSILLKRKIFFLDEITSALDQKLKQKVISFFLSKTEWTEIIISHDNEWRIQPGLKVINMEQDSVDG